MYVQAQPFGIMDWRKELFVFNVWLVTNALASTSCNFDSGLCRDWHQSIADVFNWTINTGSTWSSDTGPDYDHTSGLGKYVYIETSSPRQYGDNAKLEYSVSNSEVGKLSCLRFYYHMYGETINTLNVYNGITKMFTKSVNQGNSWLNAKLTITLQTTITFEGIRGYSYTGDIAIDDVSIVRGICQECIRNLNQSFGRLVISYSNKFDPYCKWTIGNAGIPQAVVIVSIHHMNFSGYSSEYVKIFDGNGTEVFAQYGWNSTSSNKSSSLQEIFVEDSKNITIQVSLTSQWSYVKLSYGALKKPLNLASPLAGWSITVVNKTARSIGISWNSPPSVLYNGIRFYVALARKINSSSESTGQIVVGNVTASQITELDEYAEYEVSVVAVDDDGMPFKSSEVLVMTDEGVPSRAPNGLQVTSFEFTSDLLVKWNPLSQQYANGKLLGYTIYYRDYNIVWSTYKSVNTSSPFSTQATLKVLKPAHEYVVAVAAFTSKGVGPRSAHKYAIAGCSTTLNESFGQIEFTTTSYRDHRCNWKIHSAGISRAVAFISVQELNLYSCSEFVRIIDGNGTEVLYHLGCVSFAPEILADVPFGLSNNISIQIYTQRYGNSIKMKYAILKEGLASAIPLLGWNVSIFNLTSTNFHLQWTNLHSVVNQYANFYITEVKSVQGTVLTLETVPGNITSTIIKGLEPSSKYRVGVFGIDSVGRPYKSLESVITTKEVFCGFRPSTSRIVGGTVAPINSWPWQVMVMHEYGSHFCGGSLVDPYWVVTAAHCMTGETPSDIKIRLGAHYRTFGTVGTEQDIKVAKIIVHENYQNPLQNSNDIALLSLASPAELGVGVGLVCLPDTIHQLPFDDLNKRCWITGWGHLSSWSSSPNTLMQASLPLVSKQRCENAYPGEMDDSMLCAGLDEGGIDTCQGDSGGPLVCEFNGKWYLEGVTSWGHGCAEPRHYGVYAKVRALRSWVSTNMYTVVAPSASSQNQSLPQSSSETGWCNFERGLCIGWNQSSSDDFDWTLGSGSTPSSSTGPTHGQGGSGKYMYIEASYPRKPGEIARLVVTVPNYGNQSCLSFYYHMYGTSAGTLNVYSGNIKVFSATGNQGDDWLIMETNLYLDRAVIFEGIIGSSYTGDVAIDEVKITKGSCPVSRACNFDNGLCLGWSQSTSDVFDWTLNSGPTPSSSTGPWSDLSGTGKYMYTEATAQLEGDNAKLQLVLPEGTSPSCLTFFLHMYGDSMGTLNVFNGNTSIFTASGDHGNNWRKVTRTVNSSDVLTFEGIIGSSYESDIAIDNVTVSEGTCPVSTSCNFDSELCDGWEQSYSDDFDWTRRTGSTWSSDTGPDRDHTSGTGYYMYIETSSPRVAGDNAKLEFSVPGNLGLFCLEFFYHMYGDTMGTLTVFSGSGVVFNASGNHGNTWIKAEITIPLDSVVTFEGIVGSSYTGDLAIDDVSIRRGNCQGHATSPTFTTTPIFLSSVPSDQSSPPSSQSSSSSGQSVSSPSTNGPSSSSSLPSSAVSATFTFSTARPTPSIEETEGTVEVEIRDLNIDEWDDQMESDFKEVIARAARDYCDVDGTQCELMPSSSRRRRSSNKIKFTSDMVHIFPGYPKESTENPSIVLLAFYLQLPKGFSDNVVNKDVLKAIVESNKSSIEELVGGTITGVQPYISTTATTEDSEEKPKSKNAIFIGASVGGVIMVVILAILVLRFKKKKRLIAARKNAGKGFSNNAYVNNAYFIDSEEQNIEMECGDRAFSSDLGEKYYGALNDLQTSSNHSAVVLKFPDSLVGKNSEDGAPPIYGKLSSGVDSPFSLGSAKPFYETLNSNRKSTEVRDEKISEGNAATVCQSPNNGAAAFTYQTLNNA